MIVAIRVFRDGYPVREELFGALPIRIGRSADCDLVLTDPSVSRDHAEIQRDPAGGLMIVDSAGTNGLYAGPRRVAAEPVVGRLRARLGLAEIEIEQVSAEATQPISLEDLHRLDQRRTPLTWVKYIAIAVLALITEAVISADFWSPWNSQRLVGVVWMSASALVAMLIIASILLGFLKAAGRKVRMADVLRHFAIFAWLRPVAVGVALLFYYFVPDGVATALRTWLPALATLAFLSEAAAIRRPAPNRTFRVLWALALLLVLTGFEVTHSYATRRMGQPQLDQAVQAPILGFPARSSVSFEEYAASVEAAGRRSEDLVK